MGGGERESRIRDFAPLVLFLSPCVSVFVPVRAGTCALWLVMCALSVHLRVCLGFRV